MTNDRIARGYFQEDAREALEWARFAFHCCRRLLEE
jgi:hypothetical protein